MVASRATFSAQCRQSVMEQERIYIDKIVFFFHNAVFNKQIFVRKKIAVAFIRRPSWRPYQFIGVRTLPEIAGAPPVSQHIVISRKTSVDDLAMMASYVIKPLLNESVILVILCKKER